MGRIVQQINNYQDETYSVMTTAKQLTWTLKLTLMRLESREAYSQLQMNQLSIKAADFEKEIS